MVRTFKTRSLVGSATALFSLAVVMAFVLLLSNSARALNNTGDHWQRFDLTGTNLKSVDFVAPNDGWAVGSDGVLAHWNGVEWSTYDNTSLGHESITGLDMLTSSAGWAGSTLGNVLRYDGQQWAFENSNIYTATLYSISMLNPSVGWAGGESGIFGHYDGATWQQVVPGGIITSTIWGLDLVSPTDGWAVTGTLDQSGRIGRLLRYDGTTWHQFSTVGQVLYDVDMLNPNYGWAVGAYGTLLQWDGTAWTAASSPSGNTMLDVHVLSTSDAWAVGESDLIHWDGTAWSIFSGPTSAQLRGVHTVSNVDAWAVGDRGTIYRYNGVQWSTVKSHVTLQGLHAVDFASPDDGWAVGDYGTELQGLWHWNGTNWVGYTQTSWDELYDVDMLAPNAAWAVGRYGHFLHWDGSTWLEEQGPSDASPLAVSMLSPTDGWAIGFSQGNPGRVLHYDGSVWTYDPFPNTYGWQLTSISMASPTEGWIGGRISTDSGVLLHYQDGTWTWQDPGRPINAVYMLSQSEGWAAGNDVILHYLNGTWTLESLSQTATFNDIHFLNQDEGWAVGYGLYNDPVVFLHYQAGTWTQVDSPTGSVIMGVRAVTEHKAWAVGEGDPGAILYYEEGTVPTPTLTLTATLTSSPTATPTSIPTATPCTINFSDVLPGSTFYPYVRCLTCLGIVTGYTNNTFRPEMDVTRGQLAKIVSNSANWNNIIPDNQQSFEDVQIGSTFWLFIERMFLHGAIQGYPCGGPGEPCGPGNLPYFHPGNTASRGQICKIVVLSAGLPINTVGGPHFGDVPIDATFYDYIETLYHTGAIQGYSDGNFRPSNNASRGQTTKIVSLTFFPSCTTP